MSFEILRRRKVVRGASVLSHGVGRDSSQDDESEEDEGEAQAGQNRGWVFNQSSQQKKSLGLAITSIACPGLYDRLNSRLRELDLVPFKLHQNTYISV